MNLKKLLLFIVAVLLFSNGYSQDKKLAMIGGIVKDAHTKAPLKEAVVTLSSDVFEGQKFALTDSSGTYRIINLPAGIYVISFEMEGYKKFTQESVVLKEGQSMGISFEMIREPGSGPKNKSKEVQK